MNNLKCFAKKYPYILGLLIGHTIALVADSIQAFINSGHSFLLILPCFCIFLTIYGMRSRRS